MCPGPVRGREACLGGGHDVGDTIISTATDRRLAVGMDRLGHLRPGSGWSNRYRSAWLGGQHVGVGRSGKALGTVSRAYAGMGGAAALVVTYLALLVTLSAGVAALKQDAGRFAVAFTAVFWIAYGCWIAGSNAYFATVTPADMHKFGVGWSLKLTAEGGFVVALIAGLIIANFFPKFATWLKDALRPELYIKIAIVILGGVCRRHRVRGKLAFQPPRFSRRRGDRSRPTSSIGLVPAWTIRNGGATTSSSPARAARG